jgi:hypothetical protein
MIDEAIDGLGGLDGMVLNVGIGLGARPRPRGRQGVERHVRGQPDRTDALEARRACRSGGWRRAGKSPMRRCFSSPTKAFTSTPRRWRSTAESPGYEPKSGEKISFAAGAIAAINPLPIGLRTKRVLLFSEGSRLLSLTRPSSLCASAPRRIWKTKRCDRFVHFCATPPPGSDDGWPRSSPSRPPACRPPALKPRVLYFSAITFNSDSA